MRVIIAGSRDITDYDIRGAIIQSGFEIDTVLSGCCRGVDLLGERYAKENGIPIHAYPANWNKYGRAAGPLRNAEMVRNADALILIHRPVISRGSKDVIEKARVAGLKIYRKIV